MTAREHKRARKFKTIAVIVTVLFHILLIGAIYLFAEGEFAKEENGPGASEKMAVLAESEISTLKRV